MFGIKNHFFYRLFYLPKRHLYPSPLLSFCQNHPLKLPFLTPQLTKLSKTQFSASKYLHNKLYTKQISTKSAHSRMPHPEENRQEYSLSRSSKAGIPMILALHPGQFRKPPCCFGRRTTVSAPHFRNIFV